MPQQGEAGGSENRSAKPEARPVVVHAFVDF